MKILLFLLLQGVTAQTTPEQIKIKKYIHQTLPRTWSKVKKSKYSTQLAKRIVIEAKRRNLNPYVMAAIGKLESRYRYWVSRRGDDSHGVWQTIRVEKYTLLSAQRLGGCKYSHLPTFWRRYATAWARGRDVECEDQEVANHRLRTGWFSKRELKSWDNVISTYVFARELEKHLDNARKFRYRYWVRGCGLSRSTQNKILRYSAYNTGFKKPRWYYMSRLCKYYKEILNGKDSGN